MDACSYLVTLVTLISSILSIVTGLSIRSIDVPKYAKVGGLRIFTCEEQVIKIDLLLCHSHLGYFLIFMFSMILGLFK